MAISAQSQPTPPESQPEAAPTLNPAAAARLGSMLAGKFKQYETDRRPAEEKWVRNARQYLGIYDPDVLIPANRSRAYPKLTRVKCVSMLSRLMNLLFPAGEKCWTINASAVPNLSTEDLQQVLDTLSGAGQPGQTPTDDQIEAAVRKFAQKRAARLELEIEDQLQELGGGRAQDFVALCRKVLASGIQYGCGVLRGPFIEQQEMRGWQLANNRLEAIPKTVYRPRFEFVPIWDYYPDMSAKTFEQMEGQFLRMVMSHSQVSALGDRPDFIKGQVAEVLRRYPTGNYRRKAFETELRSLGSQIDTGNGGNNKYEVFSWDGFVRGRELAECGVKIAENKMDSDLSATVWFIEGVVIKADLNPWPSLADGDTVPQYHQFIFEEDESFILGNALPNIMRDSQMGVCAATRMTLDMASVQRVFEVNTSLLRADVDIIAIEPDMIIYRDDDNQATAQYPAVRPVTISAPLAEMQVLSQQFMAFADMETFVSPATGGDLQRGPSEPFRTATGASMLRGDAALPFKDVVRNFDRFTESVIGALIVFNRVYNENANLQGDFTPAARGATSLIAKEVQGIQIDNLAQTLTAEEKKYLNTRQLLRARVRARDMDAADIVLDDDACDAIDKAQADTQAAQQQQQNQLIEAQIRKLLADTLKNIAQAGKNSANAEATTANVILAALEKGLNPDMLAATETTKGATNATSTAGPSAGAPPAGPDQGQQPGNGVAGLEAAVGNPVAAAGPSTAALPTQ